MNYKRKLPNTHAQPAQNIEPPFLLAGLARRPGRTSTYNGPDFIYVPSLALSFVNMDAMQHFEHGESRRTRQTPALNQLCGFLWQCVRPILNMAYPAQRWRRHCASIVRCGVKMDA